ncbi:MAG: PorT family protein, partial [Deltaproteobacteria bacterium]|nr:PorT family protein [Deltaproteobacteria bacterium]
MKNIIGLVIFLISSFLSGAEVLKLSKNRSSLAISNDLDNIWVIGQKICIDARNGERFCGIVVKVKTEGAICKMEAPALAVEIGDTVTMVEPLDKVNSDNKRNKSATEKAAKRGLVLGLGGGLVLGDLSIDPNVTESDWKKGMSLGLFLEIPIGYGTFSLQPGLGFSQKGYEESSTSLGLNYLDLPLLIKVGFLQGDVVPYLTAGPYVAFLMAAKSKTFFGET